MPRLDVLLHDIIRINRIRILFMKRQLAGYPLCGTMHILLTYLHNHPGASQDDLAAFYALDKTPVAREAKRLEELGYICRNIDTCNRRQYELYLTQEGETIVTAIYDAYQQFSERLSAGMTQEQWQTAAQLLKMMNENLSSL